MISITKHETGPAVEDIQQRLCKLHYLEEHCISGSFDEATALALAEFSSDQGIEFNNVVDDVLWARLVDACYTLSDRTLYLRMPYFHGNDVKELQEALGALGFAGGRVDSIFGAHTEQAVRKFQANMGLFSDGIVGSQTFAAIKSLHHSWEGKNPSLHIEGLGFARAADVLENFSVCLFGTCEFTRSVASRISNLACATNPASKIVSADCLSTPPSKEMILLHIVLPSNCTQNEVAGTDGKEACNNNVAAPRTSSSSDTQTGIPRVSYNEEETLSVRLFSALKNLNGQQRLSLELPCNKWEDAGFARSAQHYAIGLLDALCKALSLLQDKDTN